MAKYKLRIKARLILYEKGKILLLKQTKPNGGNYTLVGGNIEKDEYAKASLIRESFEEAGITLKTKDLQLVHVLQKNTLKEQRIVFYFKAYRWEGKVRSKEKDKFKAAEWFSLDKLPKNLTATVRHVMKEYRKGNLYSEIRDD
jgi:ADP-ribose pyrophosphatase YjhB (NUDIX family)